MATLRRPHQRSVAIRPRPLRPRAGHVDTYATSRILAARHALLRDPLRERRPPPSLLALLPLPPPPPRTSPAISLPPRTRARAAPRCPPPPPLRPPRCPHLSPPRPCASASGHRVRRTRKRARGPPRAARPRAGGAQACV